MRHHGMCTNNCRSYWIISQWLVTWALEIWSGFLTVAVSMARVEALAKMCAVIWHKIQSYIPEEASSSVSWWNVCLFRVPSRHRYLHRRLNRSIHRCQMHAWTLCHVKHACNAFYLFAIVQVHLLHALDPLQSNAHHAVSTRSATYVV